MLGRVVFTAQNRLLARLRFAAARGPRLFLVVAAAWLSGCAHMQRPVAEAPISLAASPRPSIATPAAAWKMAHAYAATRENAEVVLGLGDSMEPLYRNRTLLVIEKPSFTTLQPGMTAVFLGDGGSFVAHTLLRRVRGGWEARGLGNKERDDSLVTPANFRGCVTLAIELAWPLPALAADVRELRAASELRPIANLTTAFP